MKPVREEMFHEPYEGYYWARAKGIADERNIGQITLIQIRNMIFEDMHDNEASERENVS